jgi:hypothetical protein
MLDQRAEQRVQRFDLLGRELIAERALDRRAIKIRPPREPARLAALFRRRRVLAGRRGVRSVFRYFDVFDPIGDFGILSGKPKVIA